MSILDDPKIQRFGAMQEQVIQHLSHLSREHAMHLLMQWMGVEILEDAFPTLTGHQFVEPNVEKQHQNQ